ncbi:MAG TPA: hypothetical protein VF170_10025 [Planctomycetaceae bacterium]
MSLALTFSSLALVAAVLALARERRLRRSLQLVLRRLLHQLRRPEPHDPPRSPPEDPVSGDTPVGGRL